jgi:hypothetical protein
MVSVVLLVPQSFGQENVLTVLCFVLFHVQ